MKLIMILLLSYAIVMHGIAAFLIWFGYEPDNVSQSVAFILSAALMLLALISLVDDND